MKKIHEIRVKRITDPDPDLSYLETVIEDGHIVSSCQYTDDDIRTMGLEKVMEWVREDRERIDTCGTEWHCLGIRAVADVRTSTNGREWLINHISSGGLWGVESDSEESYLEQVGQDEVGSLMDTLKEYGFTQEEVDAAPVRDDGTTVPARDYTMRILADRDLFMKNLPGYEFSGKWPERYDEAPGLLFTVRNDRRQIELWAEDKKGEYGRFTVVEYGYNAGTNLYDTLIESQHGLYFPYALHSIAEAAKAGGGT